MEDDEIEQPKVGWIYGLTSPVTYKVRTIGQTTRSPHTRLTEHISHALNDRYVTKREVAWVRALAEEGLRPGIVVLEECAVENLNDREMYWIQFGLSLNWSLLNEDAGGAGRKKLVRIV